MSITAEISQSPARAERPTNVRYYVLFALLIITAVNYIQRNCIGPAATTIEKSLGITGVQLDLAAGAFFLAYTAMQVPSGWLAQRWGSRITLSLYAAGWSLALLLCAVAWNFSVLYTGRLLMGVLQAGIFPCATMILAVWYPASQRGLATALLNSFMLIGGAGGTALAGVLLEPLGWNGLFVAYAIPGLIWAVFFIVWFRNHPREHPGVNQAELDLLAAPPPSTGKAKEFPTSSTPTASQPNDNLQTDQTGVSKTKPLSVSKPLGTAPNIRTASTWLILLSLPLWLLCVQQGFRAAANRLFDTRLPTYLEVERELSKRDAAIYSSYPMWLGVVGGLVGGMLSDWILRRTRSRKLARNGVAIGSLLLSVILYVPAYYIEDVNLATAMLSLGFFVFCFSSPCAYALCIDIGGKYLAMAFGLMNTIGNLGAFGFVSSITLMVNFGGWPFAMLVWLGLHILAIICWLFLNPEVTIGEESVAR